MLVTPPDITVVTDTQWMISWPAWDQYMDIGDGPVTEYILQQTSRAASLRRRRECAPFAVFQRSMSPVEHFQFVTGSRSWMSRADSFMCFVVSTFN